MVLGRPDSCERSAAFDQIDRSIGEMPGTGQATVRLAVCSRFAPGWLIRRLGDFYSTHPGFSLQLRMYATDPELTDEVADAFVTTTPRFPASIVLQRSDGLACFSASSAC